MAASTSAILVTAAMIATTTFLNLAVVEAVTLGKPKPSTHIRPFEINYGLWPSADFSASGSSQTSQLPDDGSNEEEAPMNNDRNASSSDEDEDSPLATPVSEAEAERLLRELLCSPRNSNIPSISPRNDGLNWWQRVAFARRFRSAPSKRYLGVEIPDYVTHQGSPSVRTAVNQQFKNVLDSAGRK